jgi:ABC-type dipeptide/oligopeptide/nickel transport system permease subunit
MSLTGNRAISVSGGIILTIAIFALVGPWISPNDYLTMDFERLLLAPTTSGAHVFGTDDLGRDQFVRTMLGIRVTLLVAIVASLVSLVIQDLASFVKARHGDGEDVLSAGRAMVLDDAMQRANALALK